MPRDDDEPKYTVYRSRPKLFGRRDTWTTTGAEAGLRELRGEAPDAPRDPAGAGTPAPGAGARRSGRRPRLRRPPAQGPRDRHGRRHPGRPDRRPRRQVARAGRPRLACWSPCCCSSSPPRSSARTRRTPRARRSTTAASRSTSRTRSSCSGPTRARRRRSPAPRSAARAAPDSILLIRAGGGKSARLSIPRDTVVDIPGHGRDKINAAYAIGGPALTISHGQAVPRHRRQPRRRGQLRQLPRVHRRARRHHRPDSCVQSDINGGRRNGGYSLRLRAGENHINGRQALALARTRKNKCNPAENDLTRARAPAEDPGGDQEPPALARDVLPRAVGRVVGAEGDPLGHERPVAARPVRRGRHRRRPADARAQAERRRHAARTAAPRSRVSDGEKEARGRALPARLS